jgi:membrane-associated protease RseP (regulator of RpoE activity)
VESALKNSVLVCRPEHGERKIKKSGVLYSLNWIPFGGFVRMYGEDDPDNKKAKKDPKAFNNRPLWARIFAVSAGVIMNFILGWILLFIGFAAGMKPILITPEDIDAGIKSGTVEIDDTGVFVSGVQKGSPAEKAKYSPETLSSHLKTHLLLLGMNFYR